MKTKIGDIEVRVPNADGTGVAERIRVQVPLKWDEELGAWLLTEEAHQIIDETKARPSRSLNVLLCAVRDGRLSVPYLQSLQQPFVNWWQIRLESPVTVKTE